MLIYMQISSLGVSVLLPSLITQDDPFKLVDQFMYSFSGDTAALQFIRNL